MLEENSSINNYRTKVGMVFQSFNLFNNMTVLENCVIGQVKVLKRSRDEAVKIADQFLEKVGMYPFRDARPTSLSGGQKQRLSIARALMKDAPILILDDSLSAVDGTTEANIIKNLKQIRKNKTNIIVAHRLTAVEDCDEIIVMVGGKIVERGTHEELMNKKGWYFEQYVIQEMGGKAHA